MLSPEFRASQRSVDFLSYVVGKWLSQDEGGIREKTIATEVFHRRPDYDPSEDSFVRVKASELRKRLHAYYQGTGRTDSVRIEIPLGSYQPQIVCRVVEAPPSPAPVRRLWPLIGIAVTIAMAAVWQFPPRSAGSLQRFWAPLIGNQAILISLPVLPRYLVSGPIEQALRDPAADPQHMFPMSQIWTKDEVVGMGAGIGAAHIAAWLARSNQPYRIKAARDVRFSDLRSGPTVLLGGFSSSWTLQEMKGWRFRMVSGSPGYIVDSHSGQQWQAEGFRLNGRADKDYALITRVAEASGGRAMVALSGITTFGTQAAAEFATSEDRMQALFIRAPRGWTTGNLQALVSSRINDDVPGPPILEQAWFW